MPPSPMKPATPSSKRVASVSKQKTEAATQKRNHRRRKTKRLKLATEAAFVPQYKSTETYIKDRVELDEQLTRPRTPPRCDTEMETSDMEELALQTPPRQSKKLAKPPSLRSVAAVMEEPQVPPPPEPARQRALDLVLRAEEQRYLDVQLNLVQRQVMLTAAMPLPHTDVYLPRTPTSSTAITKELRRTPA